MSEDSSNRNVYSTLGASNHSNEAREKNDFYATPAIAIKTLLAKELFDKDIWEPACGMGHISETLISSGYNVFSTDLFDYGYGLSGLDFLSADAQKYAGQYDIITNPPYKLAKEFCIRAIELCKSKVAILARILFLEGIERYNDLFLQFPLRKAYIFTFRFQVAKDGDFEKYSGTSSAQGYAWYIWDKGYRGKTELCWFEPELRKGD